MSVRTPNGPTNDFYIGMGLYQGYALIHFLFNLVMDELTKGIQDEVLGCMLFIDDIILIDETKKGANNKLE